MKPVLFEAFIIEIEMFGRRLKVFLTENILYIDFDKKKFQKKFYNALLVSPIGFEGSN